MYSSGYVKLFLGMIFVIFDFRLGNINILPDFVGYIFILLGLSNLSTQCEFYNKAKIPAAILMVQTLFNIPYDLVNTVYTDEKLGVFRILLIVFNGIVNLYLMYNIFNGVYETSKRNNLEKLMDRTSALSKFYYITALIYIFYMPFLLNISQSENFFMILVIIIKSIAGILTAVMFMKCKTQLSEE